jgi:cob(I)alamin adenosyltransferase
MPRITKVTTRTGDQGRTRLGSGQVVWKDSARVAAYGTVDELNSLIGAVLALGPQEPVARVLLRVQNELFDLGADLSVPQEARRGAASTRIGEEEVRRLEEDQAELLQGLESLQEFILPGGSLAAAQLHVARTVCRRAERLVVSLRRAEEDVDDEVLRYLNRLSDLLFVMARCENRQRGVPEHYWKSSAVP